MASHRWWCPLRWSDMDSYGHVNNVQFLRYLEDARVAMLFHGSGLSAGSRSTGESGEGEETEGEETEGEETEGEESGEDAPSFEGKLVVVRHEIDYRRPLVYRPEPVLIRTHVTQLNAGSVTLEYLVSDGDEANATTYVTARSVLAAYDLARRRARRFTEVERAWLERCRPDG